MASLTAVKMNAWVRRLRPMTWRATSPHPVMAEALGRWADAPSDIHDHLGTMFAEAVAARPRLILELGTRGGVSTRALLAAADVTGAHMLSVDIVHCTLDGVPDRFGARWNFIQADDVEFAGAPFEAFCAERNLTPLADVILIDTSHRYEQTQRELEAWLPRLAPRGVMMFHDTHMGDGWFRRLDGRVAKGWNNQRGVIRAIEERLGGRRWDETSFFSDTVGGFVVQHAPWSSGFTVLRRTGETTNA